MAELVPFGERFGGLKQEMLQLINLTDELETEQKRAVLNQARIHELTQAIAERRRQYKSAFRRDLVYVKDAIMGYMAGDVGDLRALVMLTREREIRKPIFYNVQGPDAAAIVAAARQYNQPINVLGTSTVNDDEDKRNEKKLEDARRQEPDHWMARKF